MLDEAGDFGRFRCNQEMVELEALVAPDDLVELRQMIETHYRCTGSTAARRVIDQLNEKLLLYLFRICSNLLELPPKSGFGSSE